MYQQTTRGSPVWCGVAMAVALVLGGCASGGSGVLGSGTSVTASDPSRMTRTGFLSDYGRLTPTPWGEGIECWKEAGVEAQRYNRISIPPIEVALTPEQKEGLDPVDLKQLTDYFHDSLERAMGAELMPTDQAGDDVLVMRVALTDLIPTGVSRSLAGTVVPYAFVAEAGAGVASGRPPGSTPYLGETGMEMQFRDGQSDEVLAECRDITIGRKYAADLDDSAVGAAQTWASGYLNSFQSWAYARNAFDKWATLTAARLAQLRGSAPSH